MRLFKLRGISKKYAAACAHYRRVARQQGLPGLDFSEASLRELFAWESRGEGGVDKRKNGFAYGKWVVDLSVSMWIEDIKAGNAMKAEFLSTPLQRLHNTRKLATVQAGSLAWAYGARPPLRQMEERGKYGFEAA